MGKSSSLKMFGFMVLLAIVFLGFTSATIEAKELRWAVFVPQRDFLAPPLIQFAKDIETYTNGEIKIKISLSNGDVFKELTIDESADIQFNQNITIKDDEEKYFGKWKYIVESVSAKGSYRLMISTR